MHWQWRNQKAEKKSNEEGQEERRSYSGVCYGGGTRSKLKGFKRKNKNKKIKKLKDLKHRSELMN